MVIRSLAYHGLLALATVLVVSTPASAVLVNFTTTSSSVSCSVAGYTCSNNAMTMIDTISGPHGLVITYHPETGGNGPYDVGVPIGESTATFGYFTVTGLSGSTATDTVNANFVLGIQQTLPLVNAGLNQNLTGTIMGNIQLYNNQAVLTLSAFGAGNGTSESTSIPDPNKNVAALTFNLGSETYQVDQKTDLTTPSPAKTDPIDGDVDSSLTPEPGFYGLLSLGMVGLFGVVLRRKKQLRA